MGRRASGARRFWKPVRGQDRRGPEGVGIWGRRDRRRSAGKGGTRSLWRIRWRGRGGTRSKGPRRDSILEKSSSRTWMQNSAGRPQEKDGEVHPGESRRTDRDTTPRNFLRRVRNALKRKAVGPFVKDTVCAKSSEVIEKKAVVEPSVCARSRKPFGTIKSGQAEENTEFVFCLGKTWDCCGGKDGDSGPSPR